MFFFLKSMPRSVHEEQHLQEPNFKVRDDGGGGCEVKSLTVWRKSLVISCKGFTVIDSNGNLVYRVDNYNERPEEIILMDGSGKSVLTMRRRKKLTVADDWLVYDGDVDHDYSTGKTKSPKSPICCVKKQRTVLQADAGVLASVHYHNGTSSGKYAFTVEGSYANRSCKVLDETKRTVAEIKRKESMNGKMSFGFDVFVLVVHPGFDSGFAMALVLLLDQMFS